MFLDAATKTLLKFSENCKNSASLHSVVCFWSRSFEVPPLHSFLHGSLQIKSSSHSFAILLTLLVRIDEEIARK